MDLIDKFISGVSVELENNHYHYFNWEFYERKFDFNGVFGCYDEHNRFILYDNVIDELLFEAFNNNPINCVRLIEYIFNREGISFDFSEIKRFIDNENNGLDLEIPKMSSNELKVFISYASPDYDVARNIYNMFEEADISCFLAKVDLKGGVKWNPIILENLINSNVFILMLSKNFMCSSWCNQESSIAFLQYEFNNALLIPISIDGTNPYGILYDVQAINYNEFDSLEEFVNLIDVESISFENAFQRISDRKYDEVNKIINELRGSTSFYESNNIFNKLKFKNISSKQVNEVIEIALVNDQVLYSFKAYPFMSKNIRKFEGELDSDNVEKIKESLDL